MGLRSSCDSIARNSSLRRSISFSSASARARSRSSSRRWVSSVMTATQPSTAPSASKVGETTKCIQRRPSARVRDLDLEIDRFTGQHAGRRRLDGGEGRLTDDLAQVLSHQLLGLLAEAGCVVLVGPDQADVAVVAGDQGGRRVDDDLEVLARLSHLRLGALALGDVLAGAAQARRPTGGVSLDGGPDVDRAHGPVGADDAELRSRSGRRPPIPAPAVRSRGARSSG